MNGGNGNEVRPKIISNKSNDSEKLSPEGEMYGFGEKFRENRKMYFNYGVNNRYKVFTSIEVSRKSLTPVMIS